MKIEIEERTLMLIFVFLLVGYLCGLVVEYKYEQKVLELRKAEVSVK